MNNETDHKLDELLSRLPKPQHDTEAWLAEDHTEEFDRIVGQRRRKTWMRRWSIAAAIVGLICIAGTLLQKEAEAPVEGPVVAVVQPPTPPAPRPEAQPQPAEPTQPQRPLTAQTATPKVAAAPPAVRAMTPIDSLADIVEHIELAMQSVRDSCYVANVEKLIRTDDRLQRLVNQLILDGILADTTMSTAYSNPQHND